MIHFIMAVSAILLDLAVRLFGYAPLLQIITKPIAIFAISNRYFFRGNSELVKRALLLSAIGDVILINKQNIQAGAFFFGVGHIFYALSFFRFKKELSLGLAIASLPVPVYAVLSILTLPQTHLLYLTFLYFIVIILNFTSILLTGSKLLLFAISLFVISDSLIIRSISSKNHLDMLIMTTYWIAQLLLVQGSISLQVCNKKKD